MADAPTAAPGSKVTMVQFPPVRIEIMMASFGPSARPLVRSVRQADAFSTLPVPTRCQP
jgi:hypothetical protein